MKNEPWVLTVAGRWVDYTASGDEIQASDVDDWEGR